MTKPNLPATLRDLELGPACQKLSGKRLTFVTALTFEVPSGNGAAEAAGRIAGYSEREARQLSRDKAIVAALKELAEMKLVLTASTAIDTLREELLRPFGKDRVKAATAVLDRVLPTKQQISVEHTTVDRTGDTLKHLQHLIDIGASEDVLIGEFGTIGLQHYRGLLDKQRSEAAKIIDVEATEVSTSEPTTEPEDQSETLDDIL